MLLCYVMLVGDNINIMKTAYDLDFDLFQAFKEHSDTQKHGKKQLKLGKLFHNGSMKITLLR